METNASAARIFVQIASYCDPECPRTLADLFEKATHPERVTAGVCWQFDPVGEASLALPRGREGQVRVAAYPKQDSRGGPWARAEAARLARDEEYHLILDAHMRFEPGWDDLLLDMLARCPSEKAVISALLPNYEKGYLHLPPGGGFYRMGVTHLSTRDEPQIVHMGGIECREGELKHPASTPGVVFNFIFATVRAFAEVPLDPYIFFKGQEIAFSARLWTHGWDIWQPDRRIAYHRWHDEGRYYKNLQDERYLRTVRRVHHLLGLASTDDAEALRELDRYGLGSARTLGEYWHFYGIDIERWERSSRAHLGRWE